MSIEVPILKTMAIAAASVIYVYKWTCLSIMSVLSKSYCTCIHIGVSTDDQVNIKWTKMISMQPRIHEWYMYHEMGNFVWMSSP